MGLDGAYPWGLCVWCLWGLSAGLWVVSGGANGGRVVSDIQWVDRWINTNVFLLFIVYRVLARNMSADLFCTATLVLFSNYVCLFSGARESLRGTLL